VTTTLLYLSYQLMTGKKKQQTLLNTSRANIQDL